MSNLLNIARKTEKYEKVKEYLSTPRADKIPLPVFRREFGIRRNEFVELKRDVELAEKELRLKVIRNIQNNLMEGIDGASDKADAQGWLDEHWLEVVQYVFESAKKGNAQSQKLFAQLAGKLIEKSEVKIGLSADEITRRNLEAERQLREQGFDRRGNGLRVEEVKEELPLLSK